MWYDNFARRCVVVAVLMVSCCNLQGSSSSTSGVVAEWLIRLRSLDVLVQADAAYKPPIDIPSGEVSQLFMAMKDQSASVRRYVAAALGEVNLAPELTVPILSTALFDEDESVAQHAAVSLCKVRPFAVAALIDSLVIATDRTSKVLLDNFEREHPMAGDSTTNARHARRTGRIDINLDDSPNSNSDRNFRAEGYIGFALERLGIDALEPLLKMLRAKRLSMAVSRVRFHSDRNLAVKSRFELVAFSVLSKMGSPALPSLARYAEDGTLSPFVLELASNIFPANSFVKSLDFANNDENALRFGRLALIECKGDAKAYAHFAAQHSNDPRPKIRAYCFDALSILRVDPPFDRVLKALRDPDDDLRFSALGTLNHIMRSSSDLPTPVLIEALDNPHIEMRSAAVALLIGQMNTDAIPAIIAIQDKRFPDEVSHLIPHLIVSDVKTNRRHLIIGRRGSKVRGISWDLTTVIAALPHSDEGTVNMLASILLPTSADKTVETLINISSDNGELVENTLINMSLKSDSVRQKLVDVLSDVNEESAAIAMAVLLRTGESGAATLCEIAKDKERDSLARVRVINALSKLASSTPEVAVTLRSLLSDKVVRSAAAGGLAHTALANETLPVLMEDAYEVHSDHHYSLGDSFDKLIEVSPKDAATVLKLSELFDSWYVAVGMIARVGNGNSAFVTFLLEALRKGA